MARRRSIGESHSEMRVLEYPCSTPFSACKRVLKGTWLPQAIWSVGRPITLTIEGGPDITKVYGGCCGNARRVGHDISGPFALLLFLY